MDYCNPTEGEAQVMRDAAAAQERKCADCDKRCAGAECEVVAERDATIADLRAQLHVARAIIGDGDRTAGERATARTAELEKKLEDEGRNERALRYAGEEGPLSSKFNAEGPD